ncbi:MAG TPA: response regulator [Anaerolineae bacterium]|nr:response regulator [Anaerolineae bacterium]
MTETKRVLVVDDEESVLFILNGALARVSDDYQLEVERATDGEEALAKALKGQYDLLITDIRLPGIDGVELTEQVRRQSPDTDVIWITAYSCQKLREDAERLGVYMCLDKPLEIGRIRQAVKAALEGSEPRAGQSG